MKSALVLIADGVEELEAVTVIDLLRRAGVRVTVAAVSASKTILAQAKVSIVADELLNQIPDKLIYDALVLPGGMGAAQTFSKDEHVQELLKAFSQDQSKLLGLICAAPLALTSAKLCKGRTLTAYPGLEGKFSDYSFCNDRAVVVDANLVTSRGPGTAMAFALRLIQQLVGADKRREIETQTLLNLYPLGYESI